MLLLGLQQGGESKLSYSGDSSNSKYWKRTRILLVDNEPDITSILSIGLQDEGFAVDVFNDSLLALSNFKAGMYGLAILDINMPKMNGYELYQAMKKVDSRIKACFLSASEMYNENLKNVSPPADVKCFISKPTSVDDFVKRVKAELE